MCSERRLVRQAFRFELAPNRAQRVLLAKSVGCSRYVYNWGLAESQRLYGLTGRRPRLGELKAQLVELKKSECPWLYEVSAHIGQSALKDLSVAFERFFRGLENGGPKAGFPRFKRKSERDSARLYEVELSERHIRLPMIGRVRLKETRAARGFEGRISRRRSGGVPIAGSSRSRSSAKVRSSFRGRCAGRAMSSGSISV